MIDNQLKRDKYLTEAMGECWHKDTLGCSDFTCSLCGKLRGVNRTIEDIRTDFSTPEGFFKLWNWAIEQEWWPQVIGELVADKWDGPLRNVFSSESIARAINPDNFANAIYEYLKGR